MENEFGGKLKTLREEREWSQDELARELHVTRQAVYKWESGKGYPDINNIIRISDIFEVTIDDLIRNDKKLHNKISIDEEEAFEELSDPGFYIGFVLVIIGVFSDNESISTLFPIIGILTMCFFTDFIKSIKSLF